jgi:hypothetical protein
VRELVHVQGQQHRRDGAGDPLAAPLDDPSPYVDTDVYRLLATVVTFVGVAGQDRAPAVRSWLGEHDVTYSVGIDGRLETWRRYAVRTPPAVILVGPGGKLLRGWPGGVETDALDAELQRLVRR